MTNGVSGIALDLDIKNTSLKITKRILDFLESAIQ